MDKKQLAKNVNLIDFCRVKGIPLIDENTSNPKLEEHDSLVFFPNSKEAQWFRYSTQEGGDAIAFAQWYFDIGFKEAIDVLLDSKALTLDKAPVPKKEPFRYKAELEVESTHKLKQYLIYERKIDFKIVDLFLNLGLISQDKNNNIVFKWVDDGMLVGSNRQGTYKPKDSKRSWKLIDKNSTSNRGFNIKIGKPKNIRFFESSIDLMSYMSINKQQLKDTWFISMEGLKKSLFNHYAGIAIKEVKDPPNVYFCVDNDEKGREFAEGILEMRSPYIHINLPKEKDWNDELIYSKESSEKKINKLVEKNDYER